MTNLRKVIIVNDDFNSAKSFASAIVCPEFQIVDVFKDLRRKGVWALAEIKHEISRSFLSKKSDEILILDVELATSPQDGIALLKWFRKEGYTQSVFIYSGHISNFESIKEAKNEINRLGLDEDFIWVPVTDSQLQNMRDVLSNSKNITTNELIRAQNIKTIPWRYEYFQEISLRLLILDDNNIREVKDIIGLNEENEEIEGKYEKHSHLEINEKELFLDVKKKVSKLLMMPLETNFDNSDSFSQLYMNIYKSLAKLCREQMKTVLAIE